MALRQTFVTDNYIVNPDPDTGDQIINVRDATGVVFITFPNMQNVRQGQEFTVRSYDESAETWGIRIYPGEGELINNEAFFLMNVARGSVTVMHNGQQWVVVGGYLASVLPVRGGGTDADNAEDAVNNLGLDIKAPVRVAAKTNIDLSDLSAMTNVVNGVTLEDGDDVMPWLQTDPIENGVYHVVTAGTGSNGVWERRSDFNESAEIRAGVRVQVLEGDSFAGIYFQVISNNPVIGTDPIEIGPLNDAVAVYDPYGNKVFGYAYNEGAENYWRAETSPGNQPPTLRAFSDTNSNVSGVLALNGNGKLFQLSTIEILDQIPQDTAGDVTYSANAVLGGFLNRDPNGAPRTDTIPAATTILGLIPQHFKNLSFKLKIYNSGVGAEDITLASGSGTTLVGDCVIKAGTTREFFFHIEDTIADGGTDAITVYDLYPANITTSAQSEKLVDSFGNDAVTVVGAAGAVNNLNVTLGATGEAVTLEPVGDDTHISMNVGGKGDGLFNSLSPITSFVEKTIVDTAGNVIYTAASLINGLLVRDPNGADRTDTTPDASQIVAAIPGAVVGTSFLFTVYNTADAAETVTLALGTNVTDNGIGNFPQGSIITVRCVLDNVGTGTEAVSLWPLSPQSGGGGEPVAGPGIEFGEGTISADIGDGLAFSGNEIVVDKVAPTKLQVFVYNKTGSTVVSGTAVALCANSDGTQGVIPADSVTGVIATHIVGSLDIANNGSGYVVEQITFGSLNTNAAADYNSPLYLATNGGYTFDTPPSGAPDIVQVVGRVLVKDASTGVIVFRPEPPIKFGTNNIQNSSITAAKLDVAGALSYESYQSITPGTRIYTGPVTGTPVVGATLLQANSGATGTIITINGNGSFNIKTVTGTFTDSDLVTGTNPDTSTFTFTPAETLINTWVLPSAPAAITSITSNDGTTLPVLPSVFDLVTDKARYWDVFAPAAAPLETLVSDGWTSLYVEFASTEVTFS